MERKEGDSNLKSWELVNFCEFDKYATQAYCSIHDVDESLNLGDITQVDETELNKFNMICGGSPCQDFSAAGKQNGSVWKCNECENDDGTPTEWNPLTIHYTQRHKCPHCGSENIDKSRSSLLVEYLRVIRHNKPNFGIYENVKNIVGKKFKETFKLFTDELEEYGYLVHWKVLNAKDYGVPQNRERVYLIFIRKELDNGKFKFPEPFDNGIRLKDVLEPEVDEKYYISDEKVQKIRQTLMTIQAGNKQPHIITGLFSNKGEKYEKEIEFANTLLARDYKGFGNQAMNGVMSIGDDLRVRKLIPLECFRLMGFSDEDFYKAMIGYSKVAKEFIDNHPYLIGKTIANEATTIQGISNSQLYKMSGNSIVVDVLYFIYVELYKAMPYLFDDLKLSSFFSGIGAFEVALDRLYEGINTGNFTRPQVE